MLAITDTGHNMSDADEAYPSIPARCFLAIVALYDVSVIISTDSTTNRMGTPHDHNRA